MQYVLLFLVSMNLISCASGNGHKLYKADEFEEKVKNHPICDGPSAGRSLEATFAVYQGVPSGTLISDVGQSQGYYIEKSEKVVQNFFASLVETDVTRDERAYVNNQTGRTVIKVLGVISYGIGFLACADSICLEQELDVKAPTLPNGIHLIRVSDNPLKFVICQTGACDGLVDPFTNQKLKKSEMWRTPVYYLASETAPSITLPRFDKQTMEPDPYSSVVLSTGLDLRRFFKSHYIARHVSFPSSVSSKIDGKWKIQKSTLNLEEYCNEARPNSELYTGN